MKNLYFTFLAIVFSFNSFAVIGPITGVTTICAGSSEILSNATTGGTWSVSSSSVIYINPTTGVYSSYWFASPGSAIVTYSTSSGSATITVSVIAAPGPFSIPPATCTGTSMVLSDYPTGGTWSSSNASIASIDPVTGAFTAGSSGNVVISYTLSSGCVSTQSTTVGPIGPITGVTNVCIGGSATLSHIAMGGTWSTSSPGIATINIISGVYYGASIGTATITYGTSACYITIPVTVNPNPGSILGLPSSMCGGSSFVLSDATLGGTWSSSGAFITINSVTGVLTAAAAGTGSIIYTLSSTGCTAMATTTVVASTCTGTTPIATIARLGCTTDTVTIPILSCVTSQWQQSADNVNWVNMPGAIGFTTVFTPTSSAYYRCAITCPSSGLVTYSTASLINITSPTLHSLINHPLDTVCSDLSVDISVCGPPSSYNVTTYFGDGTSSNVVLTTGGTPHATVTHAYQTPGTYSIKQILYNGTIRVDSTSFPYEYLYCKMLPVKLYFDKDSNCVYNSSIDTFNMIPMRVKIDSNGIPIDTIIVTSGFYFKALGLAGTVYGFKILSPYSSTCTPVLYDTIQSYVNSYPVKYLGINVRGSGNFDLNINVSMIATGNRDQGADIYVSNNSFTPINATITVNYSPKYLDAPPATIPSGIFSPNTITWNISGITASTPYHARYVVYARTHLLTTADTVNTTFTVTPITGDIDVTNNVIVRNDTVKAGTDPNFIEANPVNYVLPGAKMEYTIHFENTGNDTAHNIYVMDTLSDNLDPRSLEIVAASGVMNLTMFNDGVHNIAKFDFPHINLLDSSHHGQCDGMVIYRINQRAGLTDGTSIFSHAGIFFDYNPVVMTNTVENIIELIHGSTGVCIGPVATTLTNRAQGGVWSSSNTTVATVTGGIVSGIIPGSTVVSYTVTYPNGPITVTKLITVDVAPNAGSITGPAAICIGAPVTFTDPAPGGYWVAGTGMTVSGGVVTGTAPGTSSVAYVVNTGCGTASTLHTVVIEPQADAGSISGPDIICMGSSGTFMETATGGVWTLSNGNASNVGGVVSAVSLGATTLIYSVTNSCGTKTTSKNIVIDPCAVDVKNTVQPNAVIIYPNPTTGELTITIDKDAYNSFTITNQVGQVMMQQQLTAIQTNVNIKTLPDGLYYITLRGDNGSTIMKIVKM